LILIKAASIEDGNYETVTTRMQPSVIVWELETVPDLAGFAAANDLVGKSDLRGPRGDRRQVSQPTDCQRPVPARRTFAPAPKEHCDSKSSRLG
jgi:hypothetical protein